LRFLIACAALAGFLSVEQLGQAQAPYRPPRPIIKPTPEDYYRPPLVPHIPHWQPHNLNPYPPEPQPFPPWQEQIFPQPQIQVYPNFEDQQRREADRRAAAITAVEQQLALSPRLGLEALARHRGDLHADDQTALARRIVAGLTTQADEAADPWQARRAVLEIQEQFRRLNLEGGSLSEVRALVERRCLDRRLAEVSGYLLAGQTQGASRLVHEALSELTKDNGENLGPGGELARGVVRLGREQEALSRVEAALQSAGPERRARLAELDTRDAPEAVARAVNELRELESLRAALARPGKVLPAATAIEAALAAATRVADGDPAAVRLRQDVSARLFLEGRPGEARKVLAGTAPGAESREHAAALLRDLKTVLAGEGKLSTAAVADAVAPGNPPPFVRNLAPEGQPAEWKPTTREVPPADPGPTADAERLVGKLETQVEAGVRQARTSGDEQTRTLAVQIRAHLRTQQP
jgi:hypothetical protein